jgi:rSAM/selenodomain-associated transferase 2
MKLSVVIPALNEEANLAALIPHLRAMAGVEEIVVCDGGSCDGTMRKAQELGAVVVRAPRNRGAQLNAGARAGRGEALWFLHADAWPHPESAQYIARSLRRKQVCGGNFRLRFDDESSAARMCETIARCQRRLGIYYGDSGVFVRREAFRVLQGYREWPLFEDYDFVRRLERYARRKRQRTVCATLPLGVSARRLQRGVARTVLLWLTLQVLYSLRVSPYRLARWYHRS